MYNFYFIFIPYYGKYDHICQAPKKPKSKVISNPCIDPPFNKPIIDQIDPISATIL